MKKRKLLGRPPKHQRAMADLIALRLPSDLLKKVDKAAKKNGWGRQDEIRMRLSNAFSADDPQRVS
jgi:predicted DNA binding CopG/RHH family protein